MGFPEEELLGLTARFASPSTKLEIETGEKMVKAVKTWQRSSRSAVLGRPGEQTEQQRLVH